jgi:hypothetical protein
LYKINFGDRCYA